MPFLFFSFRYETRRTNLSFRVTFLFCTDIVLFVCQCIESARAEASNLSISFVVRWVSRRVSRKVNLATSLPACGSCLSLSIGGVASGCGVNARQFPILCKLGGRLRPALHGDGDSHEPDLRHRRSLRLLPLVFLVFGASLPRFSLGSPRKRRRRQQKPGIHEFRVDR